MITSGTTYALRALAVVSLVATIAAWLTVPRLVESAYEGTSLTFFNDLISGQNEHPLQQYLDTVTRYLAVLSVGALLLSVLALGLSFERVRKFFQNKKTLRWVDGVVFIACSSFFLIVISGYTIGTGNHIEQLPMILKLLDPFYLEKDFFVQAGTEFGPRYYFSIFLASLSGAFGLENTSFVLFSLSLVLMVAATYFVGYDLFNHSHAVGMPVLSLGGNQAFFAANHLLPVTLVAPFVMLSIWAGISGRPIIAVAFACVAMPIHPLWGMIVGLLSVFTSFMICLSSDEKTKRIRDIIIATCLLVFCYVILFHGRMDATIDDATFVDIVAQFRHPHHYIPSSWSLGSYVYAVGFMGLYGLSWAAFRLSIPQQSFKIKATLLPIATVLISWIGGYFFVEVIPTRLWTTAQVFRMSTLVNWLGWIVIVGSIAVFIKEAIQSRSQGNSGKSLFSLLIRLSGQTKLAIIVIFVICMALVSRSIFYSMNLKHVAVFGSLGLLVIWFQIIPHGALRRYFPVLGIGFLLMLLVTNHLYMFGLDSFTKAPRVSIEGDELSRYLAANTTKDALVVTPPNRGDLRITAKRALVCDFKAFPFQDWAMLEWRKRMTDCYGEVHEAGFKAQRSMDKKYHLIDNQRLEDLAQKYGATHAVLYADTETRHDVLFSNKRYKLIEIH
jgi:hypothetical protein